MTSERRNLLLALVVVVGILLVLLLIPRVQERFAPVPVAAWVAIEVEESGQAVVGPVRLTAGTPFRLHAVLEAERRDGSTLYYTEAPGLVIDGESIPPQDLKPWDREESSHAKVLWFTVEGALPYLELEPGEGLERYRVTEFLRVHWPQAWSIPGSLDPANDEPLVRGGARQGNPFGTQRYHVRIELYEPGRTIAPRERYRSWEAADLLERPGDFPAAVASLPGPAGPASELFGLTQIAPPPGTDPALRERLRELTHQRIAFSRVTAIAEVLSAAGVRSSELVWRRVDLDAGLPRGEGPGEVAMGDLLRVGDRVVVVYRDEGVAGVLDRADLCLDFAEGAAARPLSEVFAGGGEVEMTSLRPGASTRVP